MRFLLFLIALTSLGSLFLGCNNHQNLGKDFSRVDSLWTQIENALNEDDSTTFQKITLLIYQARSEKLPQINWLKNQFQDHYRWKQENIKSSVLLLDALYLFDKDLPEKALTKIDSIKTNQIDIKLSALQAKATHYYMLNQWDTALKFYLESYYAAKSELSTPWIVQSANNAGTVYFYKNEYGMASKYFTEAMQGAQQLKIEIPMLLNNIITCALIDSDGKEAFELYKKFKHKFKPSNDYEKAIYDLNRVNIFWKIHDIDSFKYYLDRIEISDFGTSLRSMKDQNTLFYYAYQNEFKAFSELFNPYKKLVQSDPSQYFLNWAGLILYAQERGFSCFTREELKHFYQLKTDSKRYYLSIATLLFNSAKDNNESNYWKAKMYETELQIKDSESLNFQNDLKNQIKIHELSKENQQIRLENQIESSQHRMVLVMLIGTVLVLLLSGLSFLLYNKNKQIAIQKLQLEIQNNRSAYELSLNKKQFAERLIHANNAMIGKLNKISQKLKASKVGKDPEIIQIRRELLSISTLNHELEGELNQLNTIEDIEYLNGHLKCIAQFNQTEQQLLYYFINGHKVKEISTLTSLSEQHIRNTKSKLLKTIQKELNQEISFEELLSFKNS